VTKRYDCVQTPCQRVLADHRVQGASRPLLLGSTSSSNHMPPTTTNMQVNSLEGPTPNALYQEP